ncbi:integrase family protein, partial [Stappia sp. 22II-S9-Z10]
EVRAITKPGKYHDGDGLVLRVRGKGTKGWFFFYMADGKRREMSLGSFPDVGLADARRAAGEARTKKLEGGDPVADRKAEAEAAAAPPEPVVSSAPTFGKVADRYIEAMRGTWRNPKSSAQWQMTLDTYAAPISNTPIDLVDVEGVVSCLEPIWQTKAETATRLRGRIERVIDYATAMGMRTGDNPAVWRGRLAMVLPKAKKLARGHHPAMPWKDVPAFMAHLETVQGSAARALAFLILTAARSGEVRKMEWSEINFDEAVWTVPGERMKAGRPHRVPLTAPAMALLERQKKLPIPFPGARKMGPLSDMALTQLVRRRYGDGEKFTVHGFRSSFRDWAGDETDHPREVIEAALAHTVGDAAERAYRRSDALAKRRALMEDWAALVAPKTSA